MTVYVYSNKYSSMKVAYSKQTTTFITYYPVIGVERGATDVEVQENEQYYARICFCGWKEIHSFEFQNEDEKTRFGVFEIIH